MRNTLQPARPHRRKTPAECAQLPPSPLAAVWSFLGAAHGIFHAEGAGADASITESLRHLLVWVLVLLPYADIRLVSAWSFGNLLAGSTLLKCRAHVES